MSITLRSTRTTSRASSTHESRQTSVAPQQSSFFVPINLLATAKDYESQFSVCDFVAFPGFPEWYDKLQQRPILRSGTIASDPRYDYSFVPEYKGECVAYEAFSYGGSSGSPVFAVEKGPKPGPGISFPGFRELKLLGINAGHLNVGSSNPQHSGISYLYKSSAILGSILIRIAGWLSSDSRDRLNHRYWRPDRGQCPNSRTCGQD